MLESWGYQPQSQMGMVWINPCHYFLVQLLPYLNETPNLRPRAQNLYAGGLRQNACF